MLPSQLFKEALVTRKGTTIEVRTRDGKMISSKSVEANLLYEMLQVLKEKRHE